MLGGAGHFSSLSLQVGGDAGDVEEDDGGFAFRGRGDGPRCGMGYQFLRLHFSPTLGCLKKICEGETDWLSLLNSDIES